MAKRRVTNYLNNKDLMVEVLKSKEQGRMTDKFALMLKMLTEKYAKKGNWSGYTYNEDMQGFALLVLVDKWATFDPEKSQNPFAYYTQAIKRAFLQFMKKEKDQRDIRDKLLVLNGSNPSFHFQEEYGSNHDEEDFELLFTEYNELVSEEEIEDMAFNSLENYNYEYISDDIDNETEEENKFYE